MANKANEYPATVMCPLVNELIDAGDCIENQDIAEKLITESTMPHKYKRLSNWREICKDCKYHEFD